MTYEEWRKEFTELNEEWRYADRDALQKAAFNAGIASRDAEIATLRKLKQSWRDIFWESEQERNQLRRKVWMLQSAVKNLRDVKGRHHSEIAYKRLIEALAATEPTSIPTDT